MPFLALIAPQKANLLFVGQEEAYTWQKMK